MMKAGATKPKKPNIQKSPIIFLPFFDKN